MADRNASDELPGHVPGQFPGEGGEQAGDHDYIQDRTPYKPGGATGDTSEPSSIRTSFPGGGAAGTYSTTVDGATHQRHRSFGRPAATYGKPTTHSDSTQTEDSHTGRNAAIAGGATAATGAAAYGAFDYKESQITDPKTNVDQLDSSKQGTTYWRDADKPQQQEADHTARNTAIAGGATAATGAAAYGAYEYKESQITDPVSDPDPNQKDYGAYERAGQGGQATEPEMEKKFATYDLNDPNPERTEAMKEQQRQTEAQKAEYATAGGVAAAGAGAAGAGALASSQNDDSQRRVSQTPHPDDFGGYERAGKGGVATEGELENKFATYEVNDPNPEKTEALKEQIRRTEEQKAQLGVEDPEKPGEKKGLLAKLGLKKDKRGSREASPRASSEQTDPARSSSMSKEPADPHHEHIMIEGGDPNAPTLVVREKP